MPVALNEAGDYRSTPDGRRIYECDCCGKLEPWSNEWAWFGSYRQLEDFGLRHVAPVMTICSAKCRVELVAAGRIPAEGLDDSGEVKGAERTKPRKMTR